LTLAPFLGTLSGETKGVRMRLLGPSSLTVYRLDLVFLRASLRADERPEIAALAPEVEALLERLREERAAIEAAQEASVVMSAELGRRDDALDRRVVTFGGQVRAVNRALYDVLFPRLSPTRTAHVALAKESAEIERILGELERVPPEDPVRTAHEAPLRAALDALSAARAQSDEVDVALVLARSRLNQFRAEADRARVRVHGELQSRLGSRTEADAFFRRAPARRGAPEAEDAETEAPA
jgi:hypothetical protein